MTALASEALSPSLSKAALTALALFAWPTPPAASAQTAPFDHRWTGLVFDAFTFDGNEYWTVEDGGRIRHRGVGSSTWNFQDVPIQVKDQLRRIHFVPSVGPTGWAVGENGWIIKTTNGGAHWDVLDPNFVPNQLQVPAVLTQSGKPSKESLFDVHFLDENRGWLAGLHGIWRTIDGGSHWTRCTVNMQGSPPHTIFGPPAVQDDFLLEDIEFYSLDIVERPLPEPIPPGGPAFELVGMASAEPGLVFRTTDGFSWTVVFDIRCLCQESAAPGCTPPFSFPPLCPTCYDCSTLPSIDGCINQVLQPCEFDICNPEALSFEPWDVEISRNPTEKFAVVVGGINHPCGMIFTSIDDGTHWKRELHECYLTNSCANDPAYIDVPSNDPTWGTHVYRNQKWGALYGVGIFDEDNSAIVCGYGGESSYRDPATGVWHDRSEFNSRIWDVEVAVSNPLVGAVTDHGNGTTGKGLVVGVGGHIRETTTGGIGGAAGDAWDDASGTVHGAPWRIKDIHFTSADIGYQAGQFSRIGKTIDHGLTFQHTYQPPVEGMPTLLGVTFSTDPSKGVAVGPIKSGNLVPKILYTTDGATSLWKPAGAITLGSGGIPADLRDVCFAGWTTGTPQAADYWAAGDSGFMIHSRDDGVTWSQFIPSTGQPMTFTIRGVAFKDLSKGIFVGVGKTSWGYGASAYRYVKNGNPVWVDISPSPVGSTEPLLFSDVVISGDYAYAVGDKKNLLTGGTSGAVYKSTASLGLFGPFTILTDSSLPPFDACLTNDPFNDLAATPILIEAEIQPGTGSLWVGGQCGRVWSRTTAGVWSEFKSQTDTHIEGVSFPTQDVGYFGGHRTEIPQQCLVRYRTPPP